MLDVGALFASYHERIVVYLRRRCGDVQLAEDLAMEVWIRVQRHQDRYQDRGTPVEAWLYSIARNLLTDHQRRASCPSYGTQRTVSADLLAEQGRDVAAPITDDEERVERGDQLAAVLERLTDQQRAVVRLRLLEGYSTRETAEQLAMSEQHVKDVKRRGLDRLRRLLAISQGLEEAA